MSIKTCVVMGTFQIGNSEQGNFFESATFGLDSKFATAHDFIQYLRRDFLKGCRYRITDVIIG